jgi:hypothetical protein
MSEKTETKEIIVKPYTAEAVAEHEGKVGGKSNLREIIVTDDEGYDFYYLVKRPTRSVIQAITASNGKNDINGASKILLGCVLEGDMNAIENNGAMYLALVENITTLISGVKSEIKKL